MSHFAMMLVTKNRPSNKDVETALQPFHEYECTGKVDEYVQSMIVTEECRASYNEDTTAKLRDPEGNLHDPYQDKFYRLPTPEEAEKIGPTFGTGVAKGVVYTSKNWDDGIGYGYHARVLYVPEGYEEVRLATDELQTFAEYAADYYGLEIIGANDEPDIHEANSNGWVRVDDKGDVIEVIKRTNPDKKWDWWSIGGRWSGYLTPTEEASMRKNSDPLAPEKGEAGLLGSQSDAAGCDIIRKCDVDFESMRNRAGARAEKSYRDVMAVVGDLSDYKTWDELYAIHGNETRELFHAQRAKNALNEAAKANHDLHWTNLDEYTCSEEEYVEKQRRAATTVFAFLRDGEWAERGEMGWWACVSNEKSDWTKQFNDMLDNVPDDHWLTIIDCHI